MGRPFYLQNQRPADTCSGTKKIINKDSAFVSSWAPSILLDLDEEEEEIVNIIENCLWSACIHIGRQREMSGTKQPQDAMTSGLF